MTRNQYWNKTIKYAILMAIISYTLSYVGFSGGSILIATSIFALLTPIFAVLILLYFSLFLLVDVANGVGGVEVAIFVAFFVIGFLSFMMLKVQVKRLQYVDYSWKYVLLPLIPIPGINLIGAFYLTYLLSQSDANDVNSQVDKSVLVSRNRAKALWSVGAPMLTFVLFVTIALLFRYLLPESAMEGTAYSVVTFFVGISFILIPVGIILALFFYFKK